MLRREVLVGLAAVACAGSSAKAADGGVLVFGGTGALGAYIVKAMLAKGEKVTVFARPSSDKKRLAGLNVDYIVGNIRVKDEVLKAIGSNKYRVVIDASANRDDRGPFYENAMANIVAGAKQAGAKQIIIHSSIGVGNSEAVFVGPTAKVQTPDFARLKPNMMDKLGAEKHVLDSGLTYTIIRNGMIDYEAAPMTGKAKLVEDEMAFSRITRADLARLTADCIDQAQCANKLFHAVDDSLVGPRPPGGR